MTDTYNGAIPVYLGGANYDDMMSCFGLYQAKAARNKRFQYMT